MSATPLPLARSMRATVHSSWLATHSDPPPTARLWGLAPVLTGRPNSRLVQGSIRATLSPPVPALVTQTALGVAARSSGARGTVMVATVRPVARSMRAAVSLPGAPRSPEATVVTHSAPWATALAAVSAGTRRALPTTRLVAGSSCTTVPAPVSTHSLPLATARLPAPETGRMAANRLRSKAGNVVAVGVDGGWVDGGLLALWGAPEHPAAASSIATTSSLSHPGPRGDQPRSARTGMAHLDPRTPAEHPFYLTNAWPVPLNGPRCSWVRRPVKRWSQANGRPSAR